MTDVSCSFARLSSATPIWPSTSNPSSLSSTTLRSPSPPPLIPISVASELYSYAAQPPYNNATSLSSSSSSSPQISSSQPWAPPAGLMRMGEHLAAARGAPPLRIHTPSSQPSSSSSSAVHLSQPPNPFLASYGRQPALDGTGYQHPQAWSPYQRVAQEVAQHHSLFPHQDSTATRLMSELGWMTGANQSSTREQQQAYFVRLQQQQHELLVAQAFASGRGRSQQQQVGGSSSSSSAGSQQRIEVVDESSRLYFPPPHLHTTTNAQSSISLDPPNPSTALSQPTAASLSSNAAVPRAASANLGHRVYLLSCSHCALPLTDRGMKVSRTFFIYTQYSFLLIERGEFLTRRFTCSFRFRRQAVLLLKPHISLYSTDAVPVNVGPLFIPDGGGEAPKDGPERTCDCLTQGMGCLGCGTLLGEFEPSLFSLPNLWKLRR